MVVVLVVDMQDDMWKNAPLSEGMEESDLLKTIREGRERLHKTGMDALARDMRPFINEMRDNGGLIVWAMLESDDEMSYGGLHDTLEYDFRDKFVWKTRQSAYEENRDYFDSLARQAYEDNKILEIKVCGVWALECVINTDVSLHNAGFNSRIIGDLTIDSMKPSQDSDRPNNYEANALYQAAQETGRDSAVEWSDDILRQQRKLHENRLQFRDHAHDSALHDYVAAPSFDPEI